MGDKLQIFNVHCNREYCPTVATLHLGIHFDGDVRKRTWDPDADNYAVISGVKREEFTNHAEAVAPEILPLEVAGIENLLGSRPAGALDAEASSTPPGPDEDQR